MYHHLQEHSYTTKSRAEWSGPNIPIEWVLSRPEDDADAVGSAEQKVIRCAEQGPGAENAIGGKHNDQRTTGERP